MLHPKININSFIVAHILLMHYSFKVNLNEMDEITRLQNFQNCYPELTINIIQNHIEEKNKAAFVTSGNDQ